MHVVVLLFIYYHQISRTLLINDANSKNPGPKIRAYILKKPLPKVESLLAVPDKLEVDEAEPKPITLKKEISKTNIAAVKQKPSSIQTSSVEPATKPAAINFARLSASISNVMQEDALTYQQKIFDDCEVHKKNTGTVDCLSNIQRLGLQKQDPYKLSRIFIALDKNPKGKKKQRILAALQSKKINLRKILDNKNLSPDFRNLFSDEIAYIRGDLHYYDCDGKPNSGNCAGELNLAKIGDLIELLIPD